MKREALIFLLAGIGAVALFLLNLFCGAVDIPVSSVLKIVCGGDCANASWRFIVLESRFPQAVTAMLAGGALAVCGLLMQAMFRNPLADPSILGVSSGAGLGVAVVMLFLGGGLSVAWESVGGFAAVLVAAFLGAVVVTMIMTVLSGLVRSNAMLLVAGVMVGYLSSSVIIILNFLASADGVRSYMLWGMGNFSSVPAERLPLFASATIACLALSSLLVKSLNALVLGQRYAENLGVDTRQLRWRIMLLSGMMTAVTTAFCGPVAFVGLAVPHISRLVMRTDDYRLLLPSTILTGMIVTLMCNAACTLPSDGGIIPVNALTPVVGVPVILYIMLRKHL